MPKAACLALLMAVLICAPAAAGDEIKNYDGVKLSPYHRTYDNSIRGPQKVAKDTYRLKVDGLVQKPLSLSYKQVLAMPSVKEVVDMPCVEGWTEKLLYQGVRFSDLLALAGPKPKATWVMFHSAEGYSTGLPLKFLRGEKVLLGYKINGLPLDPTRGWPFQLVAPGKLGYKWAKWVVRVELTAKPQKGFWEKRGYSNTADATKR
ncbi:MAG: molybdopterin-dependent oxidoreductase [Desulfarculaceae bacterium]|nr:molybdopterin-dependent oxidoreductase [Desulfarculaceae bacterium]MCF8046945.1 molybdopterin-dependent oxidoreductase [Desulfarculaceae bacterium]MCF8064871.1 molybdopterin-dependent oxidoreductase [Desulfarculaceae bacterium]MCF8097487.1 molybdopterin-dependent oxidoreductase [Desulfarculaceae bacterium]MCF8124250.1 molybdopterin-dependent oxidoreductase [Desulfarculaceae bacterium]